MPLVERESLLNRFAELLESSTHVDIAVAWAGPGPAVELLLNQAENTQIRIAVGLSGNATEPSTLRRLMACADLRVAPAPRGGIFHPKFYRFRGPDRTICWVGSANLTRPGFGGNVELINEFEDTDEVASVWFEQFWQNLDEDPAPAIAHYEDNYEPDHRRPGVYRGAMHEWQGEFPDLQAIWEWEDFVAALHRLDDYCRLQQFGWDVLGDSYSYLHTIVVGGEIVRRGNWDDFSLRDRNILCGLEHLDQTGAWGLLSNLGPAGRVVGAFTPPGNPAYRNHVLTQIGNVIDAGDQAIAQAAEDAVAGIGELDGFGPGTATRFLALARPDRLVSLNGPAPAGLGAFAEMRGDAEYLGENYGLLLQALMQRPWYNADEPDEPLEREIWRCRAALVDAILYIPFHE